jgi:Na+/proline symporter
VGLTGILLAGLLSAFMGTFASTVNAAQAYIVNDVLLKYVYPNTTAKGQIRMSYIVSIVVVMFSTVIGLYVDNINSVLQWIVSALYGGYIAANVLKWHWWRFNGTGFFLGDAIGRLCSYFCAIFLPNFATFILFSRAVGYFPNRMLVGNLFIKTDRGRGAD